ncbi:hypothetical protein [Hyalangium versicolor]|uniref:hypothetical protein n=1 Tax=Hyalangium versicolor TaxID=2861190 RepID=UPI001CCC21E3|nr:hypothetical protein [Hyalangium versicolor]
MVRYSWIVPVLLTLPALGCGGIQDPNLEEAGQQGLEQVGEAQQALVRSCRTDLDCNVYANCTCLGNVCQGGEPELCSAPPQRACTTGADCRSGCSCSGGSCKDPGGTYSDYCAKPLPDAYESDDTAQTAEGYLGTPQTGHTFHEATDVDWVLVYVASAKLVTFETYNIQAADTVMKLYAYNASTGGVGALLATQDNKCVFDWPYDMNCLGSKITYNAPAQSAFFVRIENKPAWAANVYSPGAPGYSLRIF